MIDYNDQRFQDVKNEQARVENEVEGKYNGMIQESGDYYNDLINESKRYQSVQEAEQQKRTDQAINEINQQKEFAEQDLNKEQRGSYADYQKQLAGSAVSNLASGHEFGGGYSESSQVGMYNTYQNRLATAKESFNKAIINYNNQITQAQLANSSALAEIAHNALQQQLELSLQGFQYKNQLTLDLMNQKQKISDTYWDRWRNVESQINTENSLKEEIRQYNEKMAEEQRQYNEKMSYQRERDAIADAQWQKEFDLAKKKVSSSGGGGGSNLVSISKDSQGTAPTGDLKDTKYTASAILKGSELKKLGISGNDKVLKSGNGYYIKVGNKLVDVTEDMVVLQTNNSVNNAIGMVTNNKSVNTSNKLNYTSTGLISNTIKNIKSLLK